MDLILHVWRQAGPDQPGRMVTYADEARDISPDMSFLEMLDIVNERLIARGEEPIAFEHDCREGICGSLRDDDQRPGPRPPEGHGHLPAPHAQVLRRRRDLHRAVAGPGLPGAARPDRRPAGVRPHHRGRRLHHRPHRRRPRRQPHPRAQGGRATPPWTPPPASAAGPAWPRAPTAAAQLFTAAKLQHLNLLPQGQAERYAAHQGDGRHDGGVLRLLHEPRECQEACPKEISIDFIAYMNRDYVKAQIKNRKLAGQAAS